MTEMTRPRRNFYGRLKGKSLKPSQKGYIEEDLADLSPGAVSWEENPTRTPLDLPTLFEGKLVWLEIGSGGGEHMVHQAASNADVGIIGCEPYINGVAMLLGKIRRAGVSNLAVHPGDARDMFDVLPEASIDRAFLLYPDPWPKARHHHRRITSAANIDRFVSLLRQGGTLHVATDIAEYALVTQHVCAAHPELAGGVVARPDWRVVTRYETKGIEAGRTATDLIYSRVG